jgi:hypothetical protein
MVDALAHQGVSAIFGIPGVQLDDATDALYAAADRVSSIWASQSPVPPSPRRRRLGPCGPVKPGSSPRAGTAH